jgi:hypothetical protein
MGGAPPFGGSSGTGGIVTPSGGAGAGGVSNGGTSGAGGAETGGSTGAGGGGSTVEVPGVECGGSGIKEVTTDIGGRKVYIDYPCGKAQGTPVTFVLQLHGTMDQESGRHYIRGYFPVHKYMDQYNLISATPTSVVSQWGRNDGGRDEPHLMAVIDWVYTNFSGFDIKQMWITGHSWGASYTRTFACKAEFTSKVKGVVLMSGGGTMPSCSDRLAALGTVGETDIVTGELAQGPAASAHGCGAQQTQNVGNNRVTVWPACQQGWVHKNYFMLGKGHGFVPTDWPEEVMTHDMAEAIASTR